MKKLKANKDLPVRFCWECGNMLYQTKIFDTLVIDGYKRVLHKSCAEELKRGPEKIHPEHIQEEEEAT